MEDNNPKVSNTEESDIKNIEAALDSMRINKTPEYMNMPIYVYNGLKTAVEEYKKTIIGREKNEALYKADPLAYYDQQKQGKTLDSKRYYDVSKAETSDIGSDTLYKMFSKQVVDGLKKGKVITFPETWDIGNYYSGIGKDAINMYSQSSTQDLDVKQLQGVTNSEFQKTMQARMDYMINETTDDDLYKEFNASTIDKYTNKGRSNAQLIYDGLRKMVGGDDSKVDIPQYNSAAGFGRVLQKTLQSGRRLSSDIYINESYIPEKQQQYQVTTDVNMINDPFYLRGKYMAQNLKSGDYNKQFIEQTAKVSRKGGEYSTMMRGYYDQLSSQGVKVVQDPIKGVPTAVRPIELKMKQTQGGVDYSVSDSDLGQEIGYINLPQEMKDYVDKVEFMRRLTGSFETAQNQIGRAYKP